jgi:hypothetical protein
MISVVRVKVREDYVASIYGTRIAWHLQLNLAEHVLSDNH